MKLYYKINPSDYEASMNQVQEKFNMNREVDEERTMLMLDDTSQIELVSGSYDPLTDDFVMIRVVIHDKFLKEYFNSVFGEPYLEK